MRDVVSNIVVDKTASFLCLVAQWYPFTCFYGPGLLFKLARIKKGNLLAWSYCAT